VPAVTNYSPPQHRSKFASAIKLQACAPQREHCCARRTQHGFGDVTKRPALLTPKFSCWLDLQSDFGFRPNAVEAQSLRIFPKAGLWRGSQRCGPA
jgi:hypothetical protein